MRLITQNFTLRHFTPEDAADLVRNISSEKIYKGTFRIPRPYTLEIAQDFIKQRLIDYSSGNPQAMLFAIEVDGEMVGDVGFKYVLGHKAEIVYWLADKHHGKGIVPQAAAKIMEYGFNELKLAKIYAEIYVDNISSQRVIEKLGFDKTAHIKKHLIKDGEFKDIYLYEKFAD